MHILIAPNAFKNSLDAASVAEAIAEGLEKSRLRCETTCFPVGDGGDGTAQLITARYHGDKIPVDVHDPMGKKIQAYFGLIDKGKTAVIEMADASGLRLVQTESRDPLHASSFGTGELLSAALDKGVKKILLGIGGSATVDGGCGILQALGARFLGPDGKVLQQLPEGLAGLDAIDLSLLDKRVLEVELVVLCDVDNKLLGENGAAHVFGPQKGATHSAVAKLESGLSRLREVVFRQTKNDMDKIKHGGAAGGTAAGLHVLLNATLVNGTDYFLEMTGFDLALQNTDLLITGEGSIDRQTLLGKAPFGVAMRAKKRRVPVIGIAGKIPLHNDPELLEYFDVLLPIGNESSRLEPALKNTRANLVRTAFQVGNMLALTDAMKHRG
jgi:glycerate kinase